MSTIERRTRETRLRCVLTSGTGAARVATGERFLDHMLGTFARYAGLDLELDGRGDLRHHLIEDAGIVLGLALRDLVPATAARFGDRTVPMDDAVVQAVVDLGGRPYYRGPVPSRLYDHWFRSFADHARCTLHLRVLRGEDRHHTVEAAFKATGLAVRDALRDTGAVFSTKGAVALTEG